MYDLGAERERLTAELLQSLGWVAIRSAGSLGPADVAALKDGHVPLLVQVKYGSGNTFKGFGPAERRALKIAATKAGAIPVLCRWTRGEATGRFVFPEHWPADHSARSRQDYLVDPETGCWIWQKGTEDGYGRGHRDGRAWLMHRWYYTQQVGPIPDGLVLDHLCGVRPCVNPDHLEAVTRAENNWRGPLTRLTERQILAIRAAEGTYGEISARFGIDRTYAWRIRNGTVRADVPLPTTEAEQVAA